MIVYNIINHGSTNQLMLEVMHDSVFVEPNTISQVIGDLQLDAQKSKYGNYLRSLITGSKYFKPKFTGNGKIFLRATLGSYLKYKLKDNEKLIIEQNSFVACRDKIFIRPIIKPSISGFLSGIPTVRCLAQGSGTLILHMPGPIEEISLENSKFVAFDQLVAAYSPELKVSRELAAKGWLTIAHKMVTVYRGTGKILFCPHPNKDAYKYI